MPICLPGFLDHCRNHQGKPDIGISEVARFRRQINDVIQRQCMYLPSFNDQKSASGG